jgi:hypothetical protein
MPTTLAIIPSAASAWRGARLASLEATYLAAGLTVEIEAGPIGLVIYGAGRQIVATIARKLVESARAKDPRAEVEYVGTDEKEPSETRWHAVVTFDWSTQEAA